MFASRPLTRRAALARFGAGTLTAVLAGRHQPTAATQESTPNAESGQALPADILAVIDAPKYAFSRWGIHVAGRSPRSTSPAAIATR